MKLVLKGYGNELPVGSCNWKRSRF